MLTVSRVQAKLPETRGWLYEWLHCCKGFHLWLDKSNWGSAKLGRQLRPGTVWFGLEEGGGEAILVTALWATQPWYPRLLDMLTAHPMILPPSRHPLIQLDTSRQHSLPKLVLAVFRLLGRPSHARGFRRRLPDSFWHPGDMPQEVSIQPTYKNGYSSVVRNKLIVFNRLQT